MPGSYFLYDPRSVCFATIFVVEVNIEELPTVCTISVCDKGVVYLLMVPYMSCFSTCNWQFGCDVSRVNLSVPAGIPSTY